MSSKFIEQLNGKINLKRQIEVLRRQRVAKEKVVDLSVFKKNDETVAKKTVLVIDDDEILRNALKRLLETTGYDVILAEDGMAFSKLLEFSVSFDIILLDINLPWVDGYELCALIKSDNNLKSLPLILLSGRKDRSDVEKGFSMGCSDYIVKPFNVSQMVSCINKFLIDK